MVIVSYATRGIIGGTNWDDLYEWYRKTGQKKMPWATAVPGLHAFFDYKDRQKMASDYYRNTGYRTPAYVGKSPGYMGNSAVGKFALGFGVGTLRRSAYRPRRVARKSRDYTSVVWRR